MTKSDGPRNQSPNVRAQNSCRLPFIVLLPTEHRLTPPPPLTPSPSGCQPDLTSLPRSQPGV